MFSFRSQIVIVILASVAMLALAGVLVRDVISRTESRLVEEARQQCTTACQELRQQFEERAAFAADDPLDKLPWKLQDISLRGLSATVMRSYEGVEGGFRMNDSNRILGFSREGVPLTPEERAVVEGVLAAAEGSSGVVTRQAESNNDIVVAAAALDRTGRAVAWTMKRLAGVRDPVGQRRRWLLAALVLSALLGMGGLVSIWFSLQSGVASVREGLHRLEDDFHYRLPETRGDFGQIASAINQMTARRTALETELRRQDRLAALGKAVAGVAHEVRNPLNSIKLTLELLGRRMKRGRASPEDIAGAIREVDRLDQIVARLLAFGRPALTDRHLQPLRPLLDQAVNMAREHAHQQGVRIETEAGSSEDISADVDGPQIQQVLINLLLNAIEASPPGAVVKLELARTRRHAVITVTDHGAGIPEQARPHIFDVYFTTKPDGVGLGLSVSREIVMTHGGTIDFESGAGGTSFRVALPIERYQTSETESVDPRRRG